MFQVYVVDWVTALGVVVSDKSCTQRLLDSQVAFLLEHHSALNRNNMGLRC